MRFCVTYQNADSEELMMYCFKAPEDNKVTFDHIVAFEADPDALVYLQKLWCLKRNPTDEPEQVGGQTWFGNFARFLYHNLK